MTCYAFSIHLTSSFSTEIKRIENSLLETQRHDARNFSVRFLAPRGKSETSRRRRIRCQPPARAVAPKRGQLLSWSVEHRSFNVHIHEGKRRYRVRFRIYRSAWSSFFSWNNGMRNYRGLISSVLQLFPNSSLIKLPSDFTDSWISKNGARES